jgi:hypothetical protein
MASGAVSDREEVLAVVARWEHAQAEMAELSFAALTGPDVLGIQRRLEAGYRSQPAVDHKLMHQLILQCTPGELGAIGAGVSDYNLSNTVADARKRLTPAR